MRELDNGILKAEPHDKQYRPPQAGGCWICYTGDGHEDWDMMLDTEFDTFFHPLCLSVTGCDTILEYENTDKAHK